jgi:hypothetical protein
VKATDVITTVWTALVVVALVGGFLYLIGVLL